MLPLDFLGEANLDYAISHCQVKISAGFELELAVNQGLCQIGASAKLQLASN